MGSLVVNCIHNAHRESWKHIENAKERKKIQNRIAQRTYRQRIRERMADLEELVEGCNDGNSNAWARKARRRPRHDSERSCGDEFRSTPAGLGPSATPTTASSNHPSSTQSTTPSERETALTQSNFSPNSTTTTEGVLPNCFTDRVPLTGQIYLSNHAPWKDTLPTLCTWDTTSYIDVLNDAEETADTTTARDRVAVGHRQYQTTPTNPYVEFIDEDQDIDRGTLTRLIRPCWVDASGGATPQAGRTALHLAAEGGNMEMLRILLCQKADPLAQDCAERTALHIAVEGGHGDAASILLQQAPGMINLREKNGRTSLHLAAARGNADMIRQLIEAGGDFEAKDASGKTPLHLAVLRGHRDVLNILLEEGADANARVGS